MWWCICFMDYMILDYYHWCFMPCLWWLLHAFELWCLLLGFVPTLRCPSRSPPFRFMTVCVRQDHQSVMSCFMCGQTGSLHNPIFCMLLWDHQSYECSYRIIRSCEFLWISYWVYFYTHPFSLSNVSDRGRENGKREATWRVHGMPYGDLAFAFAFHFSF